MNREIGPIKQFLLSSQGERNTNTFCTVQPEEGNEPSCEILILFNLHKLILQTCMHSQPVGAGCLIDSCLLPYFMCVNSEGSGETAQMRIEPWLVAWAVAAHLCGTYHNLRSSIIVRTRYNYKIHNFAPISNLYFRILNHFMQRLPLVWPLSDACV